MAWGPALRILTGAATGVAVLFVKDAVDTIKQKKAKAAKTKREMATKWRKRRTLLRAQRSKFGSGKETVALRHAKYSSDKNRTRDSARLDVTTEAGEPVLSIAEIPEPGPLKWEDAKGAKGNKSRISSLNPLLSTIPNLGTAAHTHSTNYMEVVVPAGEKLADASTGSRALRGVFKEPNGQIKGHAELFKPEQLQRLVSGAVLMNIASVALAQKHLHDISKKLDRISEQFEEVGRFQREKRFSNIEGTLCGFMQMKRDMSDYSFTHISTDIVASECVQLAKIEKHISKDISRAIDGLGSVGGLGPEFDQGINNVVMLLKELHLCVMAKLYGYQIMAIVSPDPTWVGRRLDDVQDDIERSYMHYDSTVDAILGTLDKTRNSQGSLELLSRLRASDELENLVDAVDKEMVATRELVWSRNAPLSLRLKVNGGEIQGFAVAEH